MIAYDISVLYELVHLMHAIQYVQNRTSIRKMRLAGQEIKMKQFLEFLKEISDVNIFIYVRTLFSFKLSVVLEH